MVSGNQSPTTLVHTLDSESAPSKIRQTPLIPAKERTGTINEINFVGKYELLRNNNTVHSKLAR